MVEALAIIIDRRSKERPCKIESQIIDKKECAAPIFFIF